MALDLDELRRELFLAHGVEPDAVIETVAGFLARSHEDGRYLGDRYGWATRYVRYYLTGGAAQTDRSPEDPL